MAYGPHAVARRDGKVIFVRGAAPEEEVEITVREERRAFAFADVTAVLRPSADRRQPPCLYLPRCGGCPWQHLTVEAQRAAKEAIVREQLRRIAGIEAAVAPILPSPHEYGYRQRLKLRVAGGAVGFYAGASHTLVAVDHCLLAEPAVDAAIAWTAELAAALRAPLRRVEIMRRGDGVDVVVAGEIEGDWVADDEPACIEWLARHAAVRGLALHGKRWRRAWGDDGVTVRPEPDLPLTVRAGTFTQVNPTANQRLVATVLGLIPASARCRVLDLYAGAGNFALPLARRGAAVIAVESDRQAVGDGTANARALNLAGVRFVVDRAERAVDAFAAAGERFDTVLLDPPRSGAGEVIAGVRRLAPAQIVYVSCDPATLARDLKRLLPAYRIDTVQPIDMFPHSYHVETVVRATLA